MPEESYSFATARTRLEEIVVQVRKKDTSLEKSLDLLEEGVRLANQCTELIDHADWEAAGDGEAESAGSDETTGEGGRSRFATAATDEPADADAAEEAGTRNLRQRAGDGASERARRPGRAYYSGCTARVRGRRTTIRR